MALRGATAASVDSIDVPHRDEPVAVDGHLDEPAWQGARIVDDLAQVEPEPGEPGSVPTRVMFFRDGHSLYVGIEATDSEPDRVIARQLKRDANQNGDDRFVLILDPVGDRRGGYQFGINPLGARTDALIVGQNLNTNWDGIWYGKARRTDSGWVAEMAIPFSTLAFNDDGVHWGVNFERIIARRHETVRWTAVSRNQRVHYVGSAGQMLGLSALNVGRGIDVRPFAKVSWSEQRDRGAETDLETGFDAFWKITPTVSAALTVNTDFSETEVDDRLINLTRFSTFFPEKRAFFLEDAGVFEFGGITNTPLPFFSRRIGLDGRGNAVDLEVGLKSTGRVGPMTFGVIGAQTNDGADRHHLGVVRSRVDFLQESSAGFIFTRGNPDNTASDWLAGVDLNLQSSRWRGDRTVRVNAYALQSHAEAGGDAGAYGLGLRYPTDRVSVTASLSRIDANFRPALGYVRQSGIYQASGKVVLRWRPAMLESIDWGSAVNHVMDLSGRLDFFEASIVDFTILNKARDRVGASWFIHREELDGPLSIGPAVPVRAGIFDTQRFSAWISTGPARPLQAGITASYGGFYNGTSIETEFDLSLLRSAHVHFSLVHDFVSARLPQGDFDLHNLGVRTDVHLSPDLTISLITNWDSLSHDLGANLRMRWTVEPGRDVYFVVNQNADTSRGWRSTRSGAVAKAAWTFRF